MSQLSVRPGAPLHGSVSLPGDKSISHRALLLSALAEGTSRLSGFLPASDCQATLRCLRALGVEIEELDSSTLIIHGRGLHGLRPPRAPLDCGGSGTTMRLLSGILAGQPFRSVLTGNAQLSRRPMARIPIPLRRMGATVIDTDGHAPLIIPGGQLRGMDYVLPVASAQVKSAMLLAGLYAGDPTTVREPGPARDHTERMLQAMGADLTVNGPVITLRPGRPLRARHVNVPGDISSAAFLMAAAALVPGSEVTLDQVGLNPTRTGALDVLRSLGAEILLADAAKEGSERDWGNEPVANLTVRASPVKYTIHRAGPVNSPFHGASELQARDRFYRPHRLITEIGGTMIPRLIDELPLLALVATQAQGTTMIRDAGELRVKETDRIAATVAELHKLGAEIEARSDGFIVRGPSLLKGAEVNSHGDHRLAMTLVVAGLLASGETLVHDTDCIADSFPGFAETLRRLGASVLFPIR